jgi:predicted enzyme related to lactoylglutathione lyase
MAATQTVTIRGVDITAYLIKDTDRAKKFYGDTLGLQMTSDYGPQGGEYTFPDGTTFGIWRVDEPEWHTSGTVMFNVDDVRAAVEYYKSRGVKIAGDVFDSPVCLMAFAEDSEGNSLILHQRKNGRD